MSDTRHTCGAPPYGYSSDCPACEPQPAPDAVAQARLRTFDEWWANNEIGLPDMDVEVLRIVWAGGAAYAEAKAAAEAERYKAALRDETYGDLLALVTEIETDMKGGYWPRIGQMGALYRMAHAARASLGRGEG